MNVIVSMYNKRLYLLSQILLVLIVIKKSNKMLIILSKNYFLLHIRKSRLQFKKEMKYLIVNNQSHHCIHFEASKSRRGLLSITAVEIFNFKGLSTISPIPISPSINSTVRK